MGSPLLKSIRIRRARELFSETRTPVPKIIWKKPIECAKFMPLLSKSLLTQGQDSCKKAEILKPLSGFHACFFKECFARSDLKGRGGSSEKDKNDHLPR